MASLLITTTAGVQSMALSDIVTEICQRVNDPFEDNYQNRARDLFIASVFQGLDNPKWTRFDYHGIIGAQEFSTADEDQRNYDVLGIDNEIDEGKFIVNILDIVSQDVSGSNDLTRKFVPIDTSEANRIATDEELERIHDEVYWYLVGAKLYLHPAPHQNMKNLNFIIEYLVNPETLQTTENMLALYSVAYVYDAIDSAVGKLLAEIGLA